MKWNVFCTTHNSDCLPVEVDSEQLEGMRDEGTNENHNFNEMMNVVKKTVDLRQKRAEDVMTPIEKVTMISDSQPVTEEFLKVVSRKGHSSLPVYKHGDVNKVCGVLHVKDLMLLMDDEGRGLNTDLTVGMLLSVLEKRKRVLSLYVRIDHLLFPAMFRPEHNPGSVHE